MAFKKKFINILTNMEHALERLAPEPLPIQDLSGASAFVWDSGNQNFLPVPNIQAVPLSLLKGIEGQKATLLDNTQRFAEGYSANNALLWGVKGMGKSSLVKAVHAQLTKTCPDETNKPVSSGHKALKLIEIHREDIATLPDCLQIVSGLNDLFIIYCDDLSFDDADTSYKSLKAVLEGGLAGRPDNVIFYATSNRRHLMPRDMIENERSTAIHPAESIEEKVSLSDRFGLWIGFHHCDQQDYLEMVQDYSAHFELDTKNLEAEALAWSTIRGARSGRVAWQFIQDRAGRQKKRLAL